MRKIGGVMFRTITPNLTGVKRGCADCDWPNWHICPNRMGEDTFPKLVGTLVEQQQRKRVGQGMKGRTMSVEARTAISEAQKKRWAAIRAEREERAS